MFETNKSDNEIFTIKLNKLITADRVFRYANAKNRGKEEIKDSHFQLHSEPLLLVRVSINITCQLLSCIILYAIICKSKSAVKSVADFHVPEHFYKGRVQKKRLKRVTSYKKVG